MIANWKTSLFGIGAGAMNLFAHGVNWKQVLLSVGISAIGLFAKDSDTSGSASTI